MGAIVLADVLQLESFGQVVVELHGAQLPLSADAIAHHEVRLGPVERSFPFQFRKFQSRLG